MREGRDGEDENGAERERWKRWNEGGKKEMKRWYEKEMDRERKMDREAAEKASWREIERDIQGYCMFGGNLLDVCGGPVRQWGGALKRINGRGLWRGEAEGGEGGVRAIVVGCNQSSTNIGTLSHTYIHTPTQRR